MAHPLYDDLPEPRYFDSTSAVEITTIPTFAIIAWLERKAAEVQVGRDYKQALYYLDAALVLSHTERAAWYESAAVRIAAAIAVTKGRLQRLAEAGEPS